MIIALDTYYHDNIAKTVGVQFCNWTDERIINTYENILENPAPYVSGEFYKRELPCIIRLSKQINLSDIEAIVIHGFVYLDDMEKPGLGSHLYKYLKEKTPVIGVAKKHFATLNNNKAAICRGHSKKPLFITSIGMEVETAAEKIKSMYGDYRIPHLLKELNKLAREI